MPPRSQPDEMAPALTVPLRPIESAGDWLAGVGLTYWGPGSWTTEPRIPHPWMVNARPTTVRPWCYDHAGAVPTVPELQARLEGLGPKPPGPGGRWLNHRGKSGPRSTAGQLVEALGQLDAIDLSRPIAEQPLTTAARGWEITAFWQPTALENGEGRDPGRPVVHMALALIGAYLAASWPGTIPRWNEATGHLWANGDPLDAPWDVWRVRWQRLKGHTVAVTPGPFGLGHLFRWQAPQKNGPTMEGTF